VPGVKLRAGDRIRLVRDDEVGLPCVAYGRVGGVLGDEGLAVVMLDGELGGDVVALSRLEPVRVDTLRLTVPTDVLADPVERTGLAGMWHAEARAAGLCLAAVECWGDGRRDEAQRWSLGSVVADGQTWVLTAAVPPGGSAVVVSAERPNRWDG
jgi:hypothetical protein